MTLLQSRDPSKEESKNFNVGVVKRGHERVKKILNQVLASVEMEIS